MAGGPLAAYRSLVETGGLDLDPAQALAAEKLQHLADRLGRQPDGRRLVKRFNPFARRPESTPGLYLHGPVGRGKTMLMDLFFAGAPSPEKRRYHFQEFMADAHEAIEHARKAGARDAVPLAAEELAQNLCLLCLDELEINDIADAMVMGRLFDALLAKGVVIVATSNIAPKDLYRGGLNRQLFLPFIGLIESRMDVHELEAARDYRLQRLAGSELYITPVDRTADEALDRLWLKLTGSPGGTPESLSLKGRQIHVPQTALGVARFPFEALCEAPLGPNDYQRIAHRYHTVMIDRIPVLGPERQNAARRLTTLIDALYDNGVGLVASAEAEPDALYHGHDKSAFLRTASRLMEMRSVSYLERRNTGADAKTEINETSEIEAKITSEKDTYSAARAHAAAHLKNRDSDGE